MSGASSHQALRTVIASAIWRSVTEEDGATDWDDLWQGDREEFEQDADAVLAALFAEGYSTPQLLAPAGESPDDTAAAIDVLAREAIYEIVLAQASIDKIAHPSPGVTRQDRMAFVQRVRQRVEADKPDGPELLDAYEYLAARAESAAADSHVG